MKPFLIRFWHGTPPADNHFAKKIEKLSRKGEQNNLFWDGTLDAFAHQWGEKFLYYPAEDREKEYIAGNIFITHYGGWGMR